MTLAAQTQEVVRRLAEVQWFAEVGRPLNECDAIMVGSWEEAISASLQESWEAATLEASNELRARRYAAWPDRTAKQWNAITGELREITDRLITEKVATAFSSRSAPPEVQDSIRWNILGFLMETEVSDRLPGQFFTRVGRSFLAGRFPCGWDGHYPQGKLMIF